MTLYDFGQLDHLLKPLLRPNQTKVHDLLRARLS